MELTRRDALAALAGGGIFAYSNHTPDLTEAEFDQEIVRTLVAVAEVLYPTSVDPSEEFVETYVIGRHASNSTYRSGIAKAVTTLRRQSRQETGKDLISLAPEAREAVIRATGADRSYPNPDGTDAQRIRYYVVNDLLYALYTTTKGGRLVGQSNPAGHPGGTESYQAQSTGGWNSE